MKIDKFGGLNNVDAAEKLPLGTCVRAENVICDGSGHLLRRPGTKRLDPAPIVGSYGTFDQSQMFMVKEDLSIVRFDGEQYTNVGAVSSDSPCFWAEESARLVFLAQAGSIQVWDGAQFYPLSSVSNGLDLGTKPLVIEGEIVSINWIAGKLCVASYLNGFTKVAFSVPGLYGREIVGGDWFEIPHLVTGLESFATNLVVTTTDAIFLYNTQTGVLAKTLEYGTPEGRPIARFGVDKAYIWTTRGVVTYPDWKNITKDFYSANPGEGCGAAVMHIEGIDLLVVSHDDLGVRYNVNV